MERLKILLAEDDEVMRTLLEAKLCQLGHEVTCAVDGKEAIACCHRDYFDTVVTDIVMPNNDGFELIHELRKTQPDMCIIAISGGGRGPEGLYLTLAKTLGADAVLPKPFSASEITTLLQTCCDRGRCGCSDKTSETSSLPIRRAGAAGATKIDTVETAPQQLTP